jgi:hypothetical protein
MKLLILAFFVFLSNTSNLIADEQTIILQENDLCGRGGDLENYVGGVWELIPDTKCADGLSCTKKSEFHSENAFERWYNFRCEKTK